MALTVAAARLSMRLPAVLAAPLRRLEVAALGAAFLWPLA
jgi:hypothetical protein